VDIAVDVGVGKASWVLDASRVNGNRQSRRSMSNGMKKGEKDVDVGERKRRGIRKILIESPTTITCGPSEPVTVCSVSEAFSPSQ